MFDQIVTPLVHGPMHDSLQKIEHLWDARIEQRCPGSSEPCRRQRLLRLKEPEPDSGSDADVAHLASQIGHVAEFCCRTIPWSASGSARLLPTAIDN